MSYKQQAQQPFNYSHNLPFQPTAYQPTWESQSNSSVPCGNHKLITKYRKSGQGSYYSCTVCKFWGEDPNQLKAPTDFKKKQNYVDMNRPATPPSYPPIDPQMEQLLGQVDAINNTLHSLNSNVLTELNELKNIFHQLLQHKIEKEKKATLFASFPKNN